MKTFAVASAALVASVAASQHRGHPAFHNRHFAPESCTVYSTSYVTEGPPLPTPVANSTAYPVPTTTCTEQGHESSTVVVLPTPDVPAYSEPPVVVSKEAYTPPPPAYTPPAVSSQAPPPAPVSSKAPEASKPSKPTTGHGYGSYGETGRIVTNGQKWAITYTPYTAHGDCKDVAEVNADLAKIAELQFTTIRVYSTDCFVFKNVVPAALNHNIKIIFGIYLMGGGSGGRGPFSSYAEEQVQEIIQNAPKASIAMVIIGNEWLFNNYGTAGELASYIDHVRTKFLDAGFPSDIAFTTTETVDVWKQKGAELCSHIDVFAVQVHPFFTAKVSAEHAGDFAAEQLADAASVCPEAAAKGSYITEIGWPCKGEANGDAVPGYSQQKQAIKNILEKVGTQACVFSFQNDLWKEPGKFSVEQWWGLPVDGF